MKNNTTTKKVWQKPEVSDLDVNRTSSGVFPSGYENATNSANAS